jgi:hypothetical protein
MNYDRLPEHMREGAKMYVEHGRLSGGFLTAVLENNLVEAFGKADGINSISMENWVRWLYNDAPMNSWGSPEAVSEWCKAGGLAGLNDGKG